MSNGLTESSQSLSESILGPLADLGPPAPAQAPAPPGEAPRASQSSLFESMNEALEEAGVQNDTQNQRESVHQLAEHAMSAVSSMTQLAQYLTSLMQNVGNKGGNPQSLTNVLGLARYFDQNQTRG